MEQFPQQLMTPYDKVMHKIGKHLQLQQRFIRPRGYQVTYLADISSLTPSSRRRLVKDTPAVPATSSGYLKQLCETYMSGENCTKVHKSKTCSQVSRSKESVQRIERWHWGQRPHFEILLNKSHSKANLYNLEMFLRKSGQVIFARRFTQPRNWSFSFLTRKGSNTIE